MNRLNNINIEALAEQIVSRLTVEVEASGRHVHLSRADLEALFGPGFQLTRVKDLSQPGQFVCAQRVTLEGPRGSIPNVVVLGPERAESQVEISLTDGVVLGITPPVRLSGDIGGTPGITLRNGERVLRLEQGVIAAKRHVHMTPEDAVVQFFEYCVDPRTQDHAIELLKQWKEEQDLMEKSDGDDK